MTNMNFMTLLKKRHSVRGFLQDSVSKETLDSIFDLAQRSPSNCNTQPWSVWVVSGSKCEELGKTLFNLANQECVPNPDYKLQMSYQNVYRERQMDCASALYNNLGVIREDKAGRKEAMSRNFNFFGAPHAAFITMPKQFGTFNALDVGLYVQTLLLSMEYFGVSSCAQGALALYPDVIKDYLGIPAGHGLLVGISFGYEDPTHPANNTITTREQLTNVVTFCE